MKLKPDFEVFYCSAPSDRNWIWPIVQLLRAMRAVFNYFLSYIVLLVHFMSIVCWHCVCVGRWPGWTRLTMSQSWSMLCSTTMLRLRSSGRVMRTRLMPTICTTCTPTWQCWISFAGEWAARDSYVTVHCCHMGCTGQLLSNDSKHVDETCFEVRLEGTNGWMKKFQTCIKSTNSQVQVHYPQVRVQAQT